MSLVIIINICVNYHIGHSKSCTWASIMVNQYMAHFGLLLLMLSRVVLRAVGTTWVSHNDQIPFLVIIINIGVDYYMMLYKFCTLVLIVANEYNTCFVRCFVIWSRVIIILMCLAVLCGTAIMTGTFQSLLSIEVSIIILDFKNVA